MRSLSFLLSLLLAATCQSPSATAESPSLPGLKPRILDLMKRLEVPGASIAVVSNGQIVWAEGLGVVDSSKPRAVTTETLFQAASISKPVAAWAALCLVENKKLNLDQPIAKYLKGTRPDWSKSVSLRPAAEPQRRIVRTWIRRISRRHTLAHVGADSLRP